MRIIQMIFLRKPLLFLLLRQTRMDFRKRYLGTLLGGVWAIISPLVTISLIYFVFTYGLKSGAMGNISFLNWFIPGMLAWIFISESIIAGCGAIVENSYLVTKMVFPVRILPPTKVLASLPVHLLLLTIFMGLLLVEGAGTIRSWWQLAYYLACGIIFCTALGYITASCMVFVRDTASVVAVLVQIFFWATPIFWDPMRLAASPYHRLLLSPFNYIIQGYRDSLFNGVYFWNRPTETLAFWAVTLTLIWLGQVLFQRTRPHFADVL